MMKLGVNAVMLYDLEWPEQIETCLKAGVKYYQYRPRVVGEAQRAKGYTSQGMHKFDLTPERLIREGKALTKELRDRGMEPWGTVPTLHVTASDDVIRMDLEGAAVSEARCVRCNPGPYPKDRIFDYEEFLKRTVDRYREVVERLSGPMGIKLVIETHQNLVASGAALVWNIVRHFQPSQVGVLFDLANFVREGVNKPVLAVSVVKDYIDSVHIGGARIVDDGVDGIGARKTKYKGCDLAEGDLYIPEWIKWIKEGAGDVPLIIENYADGSPAEHLRRDADFLHKVIGSLGQR